MNFRKLCDILKEMGVLEVILDVDKYGVPYIEINGKDFRISAKNADFAEHGI